jgi:mono/diheme cytochrome c family protein
MQKWTFFASALTIVLLLYGAAAEYLTPEWRGHQRTYAEFLSEVDPSADFTVDYQQLVLPHLDRIDRCVICHVSITDPRAADLANPLMTHPGDYLEHHDPTRFGCTICHDGQGRATSSAEALAHTIEFWEEPVLLSPFLEANCARCHRSEMPVLSGAFQRGERLFIEKGCQGCHKVFDRGGTLGPDLTTVGQASFHLKRPHGDEGVELVRQFTGNVNLAYLFEAVFQPKIQPDSSQMIDYGLTEKQSEDLTVYLKSFQEHSIPAGMLASSGIRTDEPGRDLYMRYCSACHGPKGDGTNLAELGKMGPALGNPQFLAIADHGFLNAIISGSGSSIMTAWGAGGGLSEDEIARIADHVLSLRKPPPPYEEVRTMPGEARYGQISFNANCGGCHGMDAQYETDLIGPTLRSPQLLGLMDDSMMYETIVRGREGTAMPAWGFMSIQELADLMEYTRTWRTPPVKLRAFGDAVGRGSKRRGSHYYAEHCASCHGNDGEGGIGPSLTSPELLRSADDRFLHATLTRGRRGTAMSSYNYLGAGKLGDIVAYLRSHYSGEVTGTSRRTITGSEFAGKKLFDRVCAQCHGDRGQGQIGPAIGGRDFLAAATDEFIWTMAAYGRSGSQMKGNVHGAGTAELSESELNNIVSYIRTFEDEPAVLVGRSTLLGDPDIGRDYFQKYCEPCHGIGGAGGNGPAIGRPGFLAQVSDGFLLAMMMSGRDGSEMKKFGRGGFVEIGTEDAQAIVTYLRTKPDAEIGAKYVVGTPDNGQVLYNSQCRQCHGEGSFAPDLRRPRFVEAASVGYLQATMSLGRHESAMRSMIRGGAGLTELTSKEINDIIAYIKEGKE